MKPDLVMTYVDLLLRKLHLIRDIYIAFGDFFQLTFEQAAFQRLDMIDE